MNEDSYLLAVLLGIVEGLTEFLPVSSTAHLRIFQAMVGLDLESAYWKMYTVVIQLGAILAVVLYFWKRLMKFMGTFPRGEAGDRTAFTHPLSLVMIAFVATAVPAFLLTGLIKDNLESLYLMGGSLIVGGIIMWVVDVRYGRTSQVVAEPVGVAPGALTPSVAGYKDKPVPEQEVRQDGPVRTLGGGTAGSTAVMEQMRPWQALWIGLVQVLSAVFPGTSRSMSTIAAGQLAGLSRPAALEFSFFLSIPIMFAACSYDLLKTVTAEPGSADALDAALRPEQWIQLAIGFVVSFFVAWGVIAWFMAWVRRRGFVPFAIYRLIVGVVVIVAAWAGWL
ncbi:MAG: undecaprenyl-diphosphate phosphatase [Phycisphaerae bacterium]